MKADAWMPLYVSDYLRKTMRLTRDQHGGYMLLIMACWDGGGRIPNDPAQLAAIAKATPAEWKKLAPVLLPYFTIDGDDLVHDRVAEEHAKAARLSETRREAGRKGGRPAKPEQTKGGSETEPNAKANAKPNAKQIETPALVARPSPYTGPTDLSSVSNETGEGSPLSASPHFEGKDPKAKAWAVAKHLLTERGGLSAARAGDVVGKLMRDFPLDAADLIAIADACWATRSESPVPYLTKAAQEVIARRRAPGGLIDAPSERQQRSWMQDYAENDLSWRPERGPRPGQEGCRVSAAIQREFGFTPAQPEGVAA